MMSRCIREHVENARMRLEFTEPAGVNWRFRVPDGERLSLPI